MDSYWSGQRCIEQVTSRVKTLNPVRMAKDMVNKESRRSRASAIPVLFFIIDSKHTLATAIVREFFPISARNEKGRERRHTLYLLL